MNYVEEPASTPAAWEAEKWPEEVRFLMSILENHNPFGDRRRAPRALYRVRAAIELLRPDIRSSSRFIPLYTRDANSWGLGFICAYELPAGSDARLHLPSPSDRIWSIGGTIVRCASIIDGWYEGAICFADQQAAFRSDNVGSLRGETEMAFAGVGGE